ncbi:MAG: hypothetical protein KAU31_13835, partial [Spirochaetaceae bacterium]|nr:hypothetical protein [Spirochaetaceae bacterium]
IEEAMGIALYAMFVTLVVPGIIRFWRYGIVVAAAGAVNFGMTSLGLSRGPALLAAIVLPAVVFALGPRWSEPT